LTSGQGTARVRTWVILAALAAVIWLTWETPET
jgi:hypothetical protein